MVTSVEVSRDGKSLYAAAWQAAAITVFRRDLVTGELTHVQELTDADNLGGVTSVRLSPDGRYAAATAFRSQCVESYRRDPRNGKLTKLGHAKNGVAGVTGLQFPVDVEFSPDSRFLYVIDAHGPRPVILWQNGKCDGISHFRRKANLNSLKRTLVKITASTTRAVLLSIPTQRTIVVTASTAGTLVVLDRDVTTGKTTVRQVIKNGDGDVRGLDGAMGVAFSPDGQFAYTSAGRFRGDSVVGVYKFDEAGQLSLVQEIVNAEDDLPDFVGGNEIAVSADGRSVYAVASRSESIACFDRDTLTGKLTFIDTIANEAGRTRRGGGDWAQPRRSFRLRCSGEHADDLVLPPVHG